MFLSGWVIGWTIQFATAVVVWPPLAFFSGWAGSRARAWAIGSRVRSGVLLALWAMLGLMLLLALVGSATRSAPDVRDRSAADGAPAGFTPDEGTSPITATSQAAAETVKVYDYTTANPWTALVISTVDEFNAVRPPHAPRLLYVTAPGDAECLDIKNPDVWKLSGIIVCDTMRPEDFPYDPNAPVEGWAGKTDQVDEDTSWIFLNNFVPEGYYRPAEVADNTVCHEMMHAYLRGVEDNYDSDANSCVFGNLLSPGTTDIRLMEERWPAPVVEPSWTEQVRDAIPDVDIDLPDVNIGLPDLGIDIPGVDLGLPSDEPDRGLPMAEPTATPQGSIAIRSPTPATRSECDPAYPDARTCIPPGPPFNQGCAITNERLFTVRPPDPQRLDHDSDGVGCEPIVSD